MGQAVTEDQAKSGIQAHGYSGVSGLKMAWRGTAVKDGSTVSVMLDEKGNVTAR
jgi:hypothetical protein